MEEVSYTPGLGIPKECYQKNFTSFPNGTYLLSDLREMGWNEEIIGPPKNHEIFLFWVQSNEKGEGLKFIALLWCSGNPNGDTLNVTFEGIIQGSGYFDGIKYVQAIDHQGKGHLSSPNLFLMSKLYERLRELELVFCRDATK